MRKVSISSYDKEKEFIVEAMGRDGKFKVIGKVLTNYNLLNDDNLEDIWDFANWSVNDEEQMIVADGTYSGCKIECNEKLIYVILDSQIGVVNDNIIIRKHYDTNNGYYIKSTRVHKGLKNDVWCFGPMETITSEYKSNPFIC